MNGARPENISKNLTTLRRAHNAQKKKIKKKLMTQKTTIEKLIECVWWDDIYMLEYMQKNSQKLLK